MRKGLDKWTGATSPTTSRRPRPGSLDLSGQGMYKHSVVLLSHRIIAKNGLAFLALAGGWVSLCALQSEHATTVHGYVIDHEHGRLYEHG